MEGEEVKSPEAQPSGSRAPPADLHRQPEPHTNDEDDEGHLHRHAGFTPGQADFSRNDALDVDVVDRLGLYVDELGDQVRATQAGIATLQARQAEATAEATDVYTAQTQQFTVLADQQTALLQRLDAQGEAISGIAAQLPILVQQLAHVQNIVTTLPQQLQRSTRVDVGSGQPHHAARAPAAQPGSQAQSRPATSRAALAIAASPHGTRHTRTTSQSHSRGIQGDTFEVVSPPCTRTTPWCHNGCNAATRYKCLRPRCQRNRDSCLSRTSTTPNSFQPPLR